MSSPRGELELLFHQLGETELPPSAVRLERVTVLDIEFPMRLYPDHDEGNAAAFLVVFEVVRIDRAALGADVLDVRAAWQRIRRYANDLYLHRGVLVVVRVNERR